MVAVRIAGLGSYLPERVVTNAEIAPQIDSTPEWIVSHTGIENRHVAAPDEMASTLGAKAAERALASAGVKPEDIDLIILATTTPDYVGCPSTACLVQKQIGCVNAAAFDLAAACSGFVYGLEMAKSHLLCHPGQKRALVIGTELLSRSLDWRNRSYAMLFGDGAGAAVVEVVETEENVFPAQTILGADGSGFEYIIKEGGARKGWTPDPVHDFTDTIPTPYLGMDGHAVFTFAVRKLDEVLKTVCEKGGVEPASLDKIFAHQANYRIIESVARRMKLPIEQFYLYLADVGNTSSASIPLCLDKAVREGELKDGMKIALAGFGSGLTWAGTLMQWPYI